MTKNTEDRFNRLSIGLHWLMLLLFIAVYALIELRGIFPKGSDPRNAMKMWHYMLGLSIFFLVWVRLIARRLYATPAIQPTPAKWQRQSSQIMHIALYGLMIVMPLVGWMMLSAEGDPIPFFSLQLPALVEENKEMAGNLHEVHETFGTIGYVLIGLHTLAALFHHYVIRDNTLRRMSPF